MMSEEDPLGRHSAPADLTPTAKMTASGLTGLTAANIIAIAHEMGVDMSPALASTLCVVAAWLAGYLKRSRPEEADL